MKITVLFCLSIAAFAAAAEPAKAPVLTTDQKLQLREAESVALKTDRQFTALMQKIQAQVESLSEYKQSKEAADKGGRSYQQALKDVLTVIKCPECSIDMETLTVNRPAPPATTQSPAKAAAPKTP